MSDEVTDDELAAIEADVAKLPGKTWGITGRLSPMLVTDLRGMIQCGDDDDDTCADYGLRLATFPVGYVVDDASLWRFIAASRERVPRLVAEVRRLRAALAGGACGGEAMTADTITMGTAEFDAAMRPHFYFADVPVYLADDGRTIYRLDAEGRRVDVGQIVKTLPAGLVVELVPTLTSGAGTVVQK